MHAAYRDDATYGFVLWDGEGLTTDTDAEPPQPAAQATTAAASGICHVGREARPIERTYTRHGRRVPRSQNQPTAPL
jgi:hypothetical protein